MAGAELKAAVRSLEVQIRDLLFAFEVETGMRVGLVYLKRRNAEPNNDITCVELSIEFRR